MGLPALCIFGTLLALLSLFSTTATSGEGGLLGDQGFGPCAATLRPEGPCRPGQDESMCPYQFSLPPLTIHLPKQLRDLEKLVNDLQKLKDNVDQLRTMCADCKVSQTVTLSGRQREEKHGELNEGIDTHEEEMNRLNERNPERPIDFSQKCGKDSGKVGKTTGESGSTDSEKRTILEEKEKESGKGVVKETKRENLLKEVAKKDEKTKKAKGKDKLVPTSAGCERIVNMFRKKVVEKNRDTDRSRDKDRVNSKGDQDDAEENGKRKSNVKNNEKTAESDQHMWRDEREEIRKKTQTEEDSSRDEIKMSEGHDEHINKQKDQDGEKGEKEMEKGIKVEENNRKTTQIESIGRAENILKREEVEDGEIGAEIKTEGEKTVVSVQRDMSGELASSKTTERTDFVSISSTLHSIINLAPLSDSPGSNKEVTFTSPFPPPPLSSSTTHLITDVNPGMKQVVDGLSNQGTGQGGAGISGHPKLYPEEGFRTTSWPKTTATINTLGDPRLQITIPISCSPSTTSVGPVTSTTATTTPRQGLLTTSFPRGAHRTRWTASKNSSSNTKTGGNLPPGRGQEPGEKQKPVITPDGGQKFKNPKNDHKPDRAPLPDRKTEHDQKPKPSFEKLKPGKEPNRGQIPKPDHGTDHLPTNQYFKTTQAPTTEQNQFIQKPKSHQKLMPPAQRTTSPQRTQTVKETGTDPQSDQEPESVEIKMNQDSKLEKKTVNHVQTDKPDQTEKPHKKLKSEEKDQPDPRSTTREYFTPVQTPPSKLMVNSGENPLLEPKSVKESTPGQELTPDRVLIKHPDPKPKPGQKILEINQKPKLDQKHPELPTDQKTKPKARTRPEDPPRTNQRIQPPRPDQTPHPKPKSVPDQTPHPKPKSVPDQTPHPKPKSVPDQTPHPKPKSVPDQTPHPKPKSVPDQTPHPKPKSVPDQTPHPKPKSVPDQTPHPKPKSVPDQTPHPKPKSVPDQTPHPKPKSVPDQTPHPKPKSVPDQTPHPKPKSVPDQTPHPKPKSVPDQTPHPKPKSVPDQIPSAESNRTPKPRPPQRRRPPAGFTVRPGATPLQRLKAALRLKPSPMTKTDLGPLQIGETTTKGLQNPPADLPAAPGSVTESSAVSVSPVDVEFIHSLVQTITLGPKISHSMNMSDERPQTVSRAPSVPKEIPRGILPSVAPSTGPGSTNPKQASNTETSFQDEMVDNVEEIAPRTFPDPEDVMIPVPTPSASTSSTTNPDLRSATPSTSGPEPPAAESSTPSARELRVKIHQVDAFFSNSLSPNGRPPDRPPGDHPEENQGGSRPESKPSKVSMVRDCSDQLLRGSNKSGVYLVTPDLRSRSFPVFCDMELDAGGWTLLQRRQDGSVSFNRTWDEYRSGFGELDGGEFWLGNHMIHLLTRDRYMVLRVELEDFDGVMEYAEYEHFRVASERMHYRLTVGAYSGTAGDALRFSKSYDHNNKAFTTPDRDNDRYPSGNCGAYYSSGWWFDSCMAANLNGKYYVGSYKGVRDGIFWGTWRNISTEYYPTNERQSFKMVRMMIRPKSFAP